jgi:phosphatidylserine/phosphatidylglycerophosphate/cardiolipin synthase-like enzyme
VQVITQPDDGLADILTAITRARKSIDIVIFRFDLPEVEKALTAAVERGVAVRALIAHTNRGGEKKLRRLEDRLLKVGVTLSRTADDMVRYHGKLLLVDRKKAFVLGFNYTRLDVVKSRSFGLVTKKRPIVQNIFRLIEADHNRTDFTPTSPQLVVSPENARQRLSAFIRKARKELLIYDEGVTDDRMITLLNERAEAGVDVRILGRLEKKWRGLPLAVERLKGKRLHVRAIVRDRRSVFVGSQSLRKLELDERREVGIITKHPPSVKKIAATFDADWKDAAPKKARARAPREAPTPAPKKARARREPRRAPANR